MPKYPEITISLVGQDGNAYAILARVLGAMRQEGLRDKWPAFEAEATSGDYHHLLRTVMDWFETD